MKTEYSYGIVVFFRNDEGKPEFLIINQKSENGSFRGFPKGHIESGETELQAARREVQEEVGIKDIKIVGDKSFTTIYSFKSKRKNDTIEKIVTLFVGEVADKNVKIQESELNGYKRAEFDVAINLISHQNYKAILNDVVKYLNS